MQSKTLRDLKSKLKYLEKRIDKLEDRFIKLEEFMGQQILVIKRMIK